MARKRLVTIVADRPRIELKDVVSVYSGKAHHCMCGCSGKYRYASEHATWAGKDRGYSISEDEISDRRVKQVVKMMSEAEGIEILDGYIFTMRVGERQHVLYLKTEAD